MKKVLVMFLIACILCSVAGCSIPNDTDTLIQPKDTVFTIKSYDLQLTADSTFEENTGGSYDLQITNGSTYVSIMAFQYIDLPSNLTPLDVYDMQNEDLFSKRTAVKPKHRPLHSVRSPMLCIPQKKTVSRITTHPI